MVLTFAQVHILTVFRLTQLWYYPQTQETSDRQKELNQRLQRRLFLVTAVSHVISCFINVAYL